MKKYTSIPEYYADFNESQQEFAVPLIAALEDFGVVRLQWNMAVYYKDNHIIRPTKNQSRRYFWVKGKSCKHEIMYLWFYDINHFLTQHPQTRFLFDQIQKVSGQVRIKTKDDMERAIALIQLSKSL
jgi:hypothetical protein